MSQHIYCICVFYCTCCIIIYRIIDGKITATVMSRDYEDINEAMMQHIHNHHCICMTPSFNWYWTILGVTAGVSLESLLESPQESPSYLGVTALVTVLESPRWSHGAGVTALKSPSWSHCPEVTALKVTAMKSRVSEVYMALLNYNPWRSKMYQTIKLDPPMRLCCTLYKYKHYTSQLYINISLEHFFKIAQVIKKVPNRFSTMRE